jgi:hypothetical protein
VDFIENEVLNSLNSQINEKVIKIAGENVRDIYLRKDTLTDDTNCFHT